MQPRAYATVGEMSEALEKTFGRHHAIPQAVTGVYAPAMKGQDSLATELLKRTEDFARAKGRRPQNSLSPSWVRMAMIAVRKLWQVVLLILALM